MLTRKDIGWFLFNLNQYKRNYYRDLYQAYRSRIDSAPESRFEPSTSPGYLIQLEKKLTMASLMYAVLDSKTFSISDAHEVLFVYQFDKVLELTAPQMSFQTEQTRLDFIFSLSHDYNLGLSKEQMDAIRYLRASETKLSKKIYKNDLGVFVECCVRLVSITPMN